jgi:acyl-CoA reductase LuxC/acyl-protein synthetase LuxE
MSIYDEVQSFINVPRPELFDPLAMAVFRYQFENVPVYRQFCIARGASPETVGFLSQIPAVSTVAFKYADVLGAAEAASPAALTFTTSGTTEGFIERGRHRVTRPEIYRTSAITHLRRMLFPDGRRMAILALHPTADRMPESSLSTMLGWGIEAFGTGATMCVATRSSIDTAAAIEYLDAIQSRGEPVCILGTTAASSALFAAVARRGRAIRLAARSRLMDTGGAKGQVIPLTPVEVVERAGETLGIEPALVINEYGMTEMCSQLYDATQFNSEFEAQPVGSGHRLKLAPPWCRPTVLDPVTLNPVDESQVGLLTFFDLANVGSISALMTEDFGMVQGGAVAILGRAAAAGARGCALSIDEFAIPERAAWTGRTRGKSTLRVAGEIGAAVYYRANSEAEGGACGPATIESLEIVAMLSTLAVGLRAAMRQRVTPERVAAAIGATCARWRDRDFAPRRETVAAIAAAWGWSEPLLDESIDALIAPFSGEALENFARRGLHRSDLVGLIMPGNIPGAGIHEIAVGLIAGCALMVKTASAEPIFFARFAQTLRQVDAAVGARIAVINWSRERSELTAAWRTNCDWIAAFGADETIAQLASSTQDASKEGVGRLAAGFGNRVSGALVAAETAAGANAATVADAIARDVSLFEQRGCLSPHHIFVESPDGGAAREFARELAAALERCAERMPSPRRYGLEDAAALRRVRESARWRAIGGDALVLREGAGLGWTVICDEAAVFTPTPGYRTVTVSPIGDLEELKRRLQPVGGRIEAFAIAASAARRERLYAALAALGICYLCTPGAMQSPSLDWPHGGGAFMRALAS